MQEIRQYLSNHILIADGATGTYLSSLTGRSVVACETLNRSNPELIHRVHSEYVKSGARLILTNTFCANIYSLGMEPEQISDIIKSGISLARSAAGDEAYVAGDIGPVPETVLDEDVIFEEYMRIADVFLGEGIRVFQFETFADAEYPIKTAAYIKSKAPDAFILISFAVTPDGYSRMGLRGSALLDRVKNSGVADAVGFNCCSGPAHLLNYASKLDFGTMFPLLMPNAGYPEIEDEVLRYSGMPEYFAQKLSEAPSYGFRILGGCCGTTPEHIRQLTALTGKKVPDSTGHPKKAAIASTVTLKVGNPFYNVLQSGKKAVVMELDPPFDTNMTKLEEAAELAKQAGTDALTIADSPMGRPRADSIVIASRLKKLTGLDVIPHICCRDRNINAIKSALIAAHIEGLRNILAVTGDPVSETDRSFVKSVFNINSAGMCGFVRDLNEDIFKGEPFVCGCAFNVNARNIEEELYRLDKKIAAGAGFVLTQPVFSDDAIKGLIMARAKHVKLLAGILTPLSYRNAQFMANEIPGVVLPYDLLQRFTPDMTREEGEQAGISISLATVQKIAPYVDGFYFMTPFNRVSVTAQVLRGMRDRKIL